MQQEHILKDRSGTWDSHDGGTDGELGRKLYPEHPGLHNVSGGPGPRLSLKTEKSMATTKLTLTQHTFKICLYYLTMWWQMCMCVSCVCACVGAEWPLQKSLIFLHSVILEMKRRWAGLALVASPTEPCHQHSKDMLYCTSNMRLKSQTVKIIKGKRWGFNL